MRVLVYRDASFAAACRSVQTPAAVPFLWAAGCRAPDSYPPALDFQGHTSTCEPLFSDESSRGEHACRDENEETEFPKTYVNARIDMRTRVRWEHVIMAR